MSKKKACKRCKLFVEEDTCPVCATSSFTTSWQGRLYINDAARSTIAQKIGIKKVTFDRRGYKYHGRVKALAEGARLGGLKF